MPAKMSDASDIICVGHCDLKLFALTFPDTCPKCQANLRECDLKNLPFTVPSPFSRAQDHPCSIVIKPTHGDFLIDYQNKHNLHIGITNSKGFVIEYDSKGIHQDRTLDWNRCIVIHMNNYIDPDVVSDPDWPEYWDLCLNQTLMSSPNWTIDSYQAEDHNCFAFVLAFLRSLKQKPLSNHANNKLEFCTKYVLPKTTVAGKYICLYRKIRDNNGLYTASAKK